MVFPLEKEICFSFMMIMCAFHSFATAERTWTVTNSNCGGNINLDTINMLHLNYYGDQIGDPSKRLFSYHDDKMCLYSISSSMEDDREICILLNLKKGQSPWDLTCQQTFKIYFGVYNAYIPSKYHCVDLTPLCTSEQNIYVVFTSETSGVFKLLNRTVSVELDIYLRKKIVTTTERHSSVTPVLAEESDDGFIKSSVWIPIVCVLVLGSCAGCVYCCCCRNEDDESQDSNNQSRNRPPENFVMLHRPVYQLPPENHPASTSADPPDYYTVCPTGPGPEKQSFTEPAEPYPSELGFEGHTVIPSAPPPPYPGVTG